MLLTNATKTISLRTINSFEPTGWAICRGIIAVYSCLGLVVFSAYSGYTEKQLYSNQAYIVKETLMTECFDIAPGPNTVTAFTTDLVSIFQMLEILILMTITKSSTGLWANPTVIPLNKTTPPVLSPNGNSIPGDEYRSMAQGVWTGGFSLVHPIEGFDLHWDGNYSLVMWAASASRIAFMNSTQIRLTKPLILAPFKQYTISLTMIKYILGDFWFISYRSGASFRFLLRTISCLTQITQKISESQITDPDPTHRWQRFHTATTASQ